VRPSWSSGTFRRRTSASRTHEGVVAGAGLIRRLAPLVVLALAVTACTRVDTAPAPGASSAGVRHAWTVPDTLRVGSGLVPRTLNPILATQTIESALNRLTNDMLVTVDTHGNFVPELAREVPTLANGGISADGLTITYHLRNHVTWHDGFTFTSRDVKFSFDAIMNKDNDVISRHGYDLVTRVDTPNPLTVVFHLKKRFAPFVATVFGESDSPYCIVPAHLLAKYESLNDVPYNAHPIGTGPYKFVRWIRGDRIEFERNDAYYGGRPKIAHIIWRLIPDENTEITLLRTHEIDWMFEASVSTYKTIKSLPETTVILQPVNGFEAIIVNTSAGHPGASRAFRRALATALDAARLTDDLTFGAGILATGDLPSFMWAFDPALKRLPLDPASSRAAFATLGYTPAKPLVTDLVYETSQIVNRSLSVQIQEALRPLGLDVRPVAQLSSTIYGGYGAGGTFARGKYDLGLYTWTAGIDPDNSAQFACANRPPAGYNESFYCSAGMDEAQARALGSYDIPARKAAYATVERHVVEDAPMVVLWWQRYVQAINPDLHGFDPNPVTETWDVANWSI
jgi:peptide/nickel transport system substrate-binding protein